MQFTTEQHTILETTGNIRINAVAGSGKTTTIIEYAKTRPRNSRILYLAFNKSVKVDASKKFISKGITNVQVETAHSLAYKNIVFKHKYKVKGQGCKTHEIVELLNLQGNGEEHAEFIIANHINKFIAYYCNSNCLQIEDLNYLDIIIDPKAKKFVRSVYSYIKTQTIRLLQKMDSGEIEITHDFYLKKFHLSNPKLSFDYILFDEGQDASPAMLDIFLKQTATKIIVGDTHQQIYSWRFAVNSLEQVDFKTYYLSTSFRFCQRVADLAMTILQWKAHFSSYSPIPITGKGNNKTCLTKAVLARTNLGLLLKAIEYVIDKEMVNRIYFEGNIHSYTYADDGASLYDVLNLYNGKNHLIRDKLIRKMKSLQELIDYVDKTEDMQLGIMINIVEKYGNEIPTIIQTIKSKHVADGEKDAAEMIFSTVHRSKGMEYDSVELVNDFITETTVLKLKEEAKKNVLNTTWINEEINLFYVALTRTRNNILIPASILPSGYPSCEQIQVIQDEEGLEKTALTLQSAIESVEREKAWSVDEVRKQHPTAYAPWSIELDHELTLLRRENSSIKELALKFGRTNGAIRSRLKRLGFE